MVWCVDGDVLGSHSQQSKIVSSVIVNIKRQTKQKVEQENKNRKEANNKMFSVQNVPIRTSFIELKDTTQQFVWQELIDINRNVEPAWFNQYRESVRSFVVLLAIVQMLMWTKFCRPTNFHRSHTRSGLRPETKSSVLLSMKQCD